MRTHIPEHIRATAPIAGIDDDGHETVFDIGTVFDVVDIIPADPSVGIFERDVIVMHPGDPGVQVSLVDAEWPDVEYVDRSESGFGGRVEHPGNVENFTC